MLTLLTLLACDTRPGKTGGEDSAGCEAAAWYTDLDGDGYGDPDAMVSDCAVPAGAVANADDCDDADAGVHPEADEVCDGVDNNCNGLIDDSDPAVVGQTAWYPDADGDGFGAFDATPRISCFDVGTDVADDSDCNDADASVNLDADEVCDGHDNDCDGLVDDADPDLVGDVDWYPDADADGYGDADATVVISCAPVDGSVNDDTDCDDVDPDVNPAAPEVCNNGVDDDCDGGAASCLGSGSLSGADAEFTGIGSGDYAGQAVSGAGDVNGDGYDDMLIGAVDANGGMSNPAGAAYIVFGGPAPTSGSLSGAGATYDGEGTEEAGYSVAGLGDVDGDGYDDVLIGANYYGDDPDDPSHPSGASYLVLGGPRPTSSAVSAAGVAYIGQARDASADGLAGAGDVNGDGFADMLIGAPGNTDGGQASGAAYLVLGGPSAAGGSLADADAEYTGQAWPVQDEVGAAVAGAGDVNGDGLDDMLIGAPTNSEGGEFSGAAYLILGGPTPKSAALTGVDAEFVGETARDEAGRSVAGSGDVNADGYADFLIGAYGNSDGSLEGGAVYLLLGGPMPASASLSFADAEYTGRAGDKVGAGTSVSGAGDVDGDGHDDILIGACEDNEAGFDAGAAYLVLGSSSPTGESLSVADASYLGAAPADYAGWSVSGAGDVNQDGHDDLLIGAYPSSDGGSPETGATYLILGAGI